MELTSNLKETVIAPLREVSQRAADLRQHP